MILNYLKYLVLVLVLLGDCTLGNESEVEALVESTNNGVGFELVQKGLENLQYSFMELFVHVKELGEMVKNNQRSIEQNQLQTNSLLQRHQKQIVDRVEDLESGVAANVSLMISYSKQILDLQTNCANHEIINRELVKLKPLPIERSSSVKMIPTLFSTNSKLTESKPIESCGKTDSTESGLFNMSISNRNEPISVFCELKDFDGKWLVIQQRKNGAVNFYRNWTEYKHGFGIVGEEFWIGLEILHEITNSDDHELVIELRDFTGSYSYARYSHFVIGGENENFKLVKLGEYSGSAQDSFTRNINSMFSTFDNDNDGVYNNCAEDFKGAWWFGGSNCLDSNLNGDYRDAADWKTITWMTTTALEYTRMMIRKMENV